MTCTGCAVSVLASSQPAHEWVALTVVDQGVSRRLWWCGWEYLSEGADLVPSSWVMA